MFKKIISAKNSSGKDYTKIKKWDLKKIKKEKKFILP